MISTGTIPGGTIKISQIHENTEQTLIQITEDKLTLHLSTHLQKCESRLKWQFPAGVLVALIPVVLTSDFKDAFFIDKATWKAFFMLSICACTIWVVLEARRAFTSITTSELINKIKNTH